MNAPLQPETRSASSTQQVMSDCPQCSASLVVLSVIAGKANSEYWTMRCTKCGGIHLDIVKPVKAFPISADGSDLFA